MEININGVFITLTDAQLKEIAKQTQRPNWKDRLIQPEKEDYYYVDSCAINGFVATHSSRGGFRNPERAFKSSGQAKLLAKKCNLMIEMHNFAYAMNEGEIANHNYIDVAKFGIDMLYNYPRVCANYRINSFVFGVCVKSEEIAEQMLAEFGERIKEVYNTQY